MASNKIREVEITIEAALLQQRDDLLAAVREFRKTAGVHEGEHHYNKFTTCSMCEESYVRAEERPLATIKSTRGTSAEVVWIAGCPSLLRTLEQTA